jgi:nitroreductase
VLAGDDLARFKALIADKLATGVMGDGPTEYQIYPPSLKEPYKARRFKCGEDMYATLGVPREDKAGRMLHFARNFEFFGAPVAMFFAIDRSMQQGQWSDLGMYIQSLMLLAREHGLHTAPQEAWAIWHKTVAAYVGIPDALMLFCGLGLGHMDQSHPVNRLRTDRAPLTEFASLRGF